MAGKGLSPLLAGKNARVGARIPVAYREMGSASRRFGKGWRFFQSHIGHLQYATGGPWKQRVLLESACEKRVMVASDALLINLTGEQAGKSAHCTDIWAGAETHKLVSEEQAKKRKAGKKQ